MVTATGDERRAATQGIAPPTDLLRWHDGLKRLPRNEVDVQVIVRDLVARMTLRHEPHINVVDGWKVFQSDEFRPGFARLKVSLGHHVLNADDLALVHAVDRPERVVFWVDPMLSHHWNDLR